MRRLVITAALLLVPALAGCGGGGSSDSEHPIAAAIKKTSEQVSERTTLAGMVTLSGQTLRLRGQGGFDHEKQEGYLELDVTGPGAGGPSQPVDQVFVRNVFWLKSPLFTSSLPSGKEWVKVDLRRADKSLGFNFKALLGQTPDDALEQLRRTANTVTTVGEEKIDGVKTTHYRAAVDPRKVPPNDKMQRLTGAVYEPIDVWIDEDDLVRQVKLDYTAKADPARSERAHTVITMKLIDFGAPVDVQPPDPDLVVDATAQVGMG